MEAGDSKKRPRGSTSGSSAGGPPPSPKRIIVRTADMSFKKLEEVVRHVTEGFKEHDTNAEVAQYIKWGLDRYLCGQDSWHCIIGNFSLSVSHEAEMYAYLTRGDTKICVYKTAEAQYLKDK